MLAGFRAAYEPYLPAADPQDVSVAETVTPDDPHDTAPDLRPEPRAPQQSPAPTSVRSPAAPARTETGARLSAGRAVAGAALSVGGVVLGIATLLWVTDDPSARRDPGPRAPAVQLPTVDPEPVTVLNNSRIAGLAARGGRQFRDAGWPVAATGSFRGRLAATTVDYPPGQEAAARAFAERFRGSAASCRAWPGCRAAG